MSYNVDIFCKPWIRNVDKTSMAIWIIIQIRCLWSASAHQLSRLNHSATTAALWQNCFSQSFINLKNLEGHTTCCVACNLKKKVARSAAALSLTWSWRFLRHKCTLQCLGRRRSWWPWWRRCRPWSSGTWTRWTRRRAHRSSTTRAYRWQRSTETETKCVKSGSN